MSESTRAPRRSSHARPRLRAGDDARHARGAPAWRGTVVLGAALFAVTLWGVTPIATKLAVGGLDALSVGLLRTVLGALLAVPLVGLARLAPPRDRSARLYLAASSLSGFVLFPILFTLGVARTTAAHAALLLALAPIFTGLIAAVIERRAPRLRWWIGSLVAVLGSVLLIGERFGLSGGGSSVTGDLLVTAAAILVSVGYVAGGRAARDVGAWAVTFWGLILGGLVLLPLLPIVLPGVALREAAPQVWGAVAYLAVMSSIVAYAAWYWALSAGDMGRTGAVQFLQPLVGVLLAPVLLAETLTLPLLVAGAVILAGVALTQTAPRPSGRVP